MPIYATVILDSGCFLPIKDGGTYTEIGYFCSSESVSDIRVVADGVQVNKPKRLNLSQNGKKCRIEIRHVTAKGKVKQDGVKGEKGFHKHILHLMDIYDKNMSVDPEKFDCILHFDTGHFSAAMIKPRLFRKHIKMADGKMEMTVNAESKDIGRPIAHNVNVLFTLNKGEALEILRDGKLIWSSKDIDATARIDLEIVADNSTTEKFYVIALKDALDTYWMPNSGDPPPMCPEPPCQP